MDEPLAAQGIRFREFRGADIPALVEIRTRATPDNPGSQERMEYFEKTYPADNRRLGYQQRPGILLWSKPLTPQHEAEHD